MAAAAFAAENTPTPTPTSPSSSPIHILLALRWENTNVPILSAIESFQPAANFVFVQVPTLLAKNQFLSSLPKATVLSKRVHVHVEEEEKEEEEQKLTTTPQPLLLPQTQKEGGGQAEEENKTNVGGGGGGGGAEASENAVSPAPTTPLLSSNSYVTEASRIEKFLERVFDFATNYEQQRFRFSHVIYGNQYQNLLVDKPAEATTFFDKLKTEETDHVLWKSNCLFTTHFEERAGNEKGEGEDEGGIMSWEEHKFHSQTWLLPITSLRLGTFKIVNPSGFSQLQFSSFKTISDFIVRTPFELLQVQRKNQLAEFATFFEQTKPIDDPISLFFNYILLQSSSSSSSPTEGVAVAFQEALAAATKANNVNLASLVLYEEAKRLTLKNKQVNSDVWILLSKAYALNPTCRCIALAYCVAAFKSAMWPQLLEACLFRLLTLPKGISNVAFVDMACAALTNIPKQHFQTHHDIFFAKEMNDLTFGAVYRKSMPELVRLKLPLLVKTLSSFGASTYMLKFAFPAKASSSSSSSSFASINLTTAPSSSPAQQREGKEEEEEEKKETGVVVAPATPPPPPPSSQKAAAIAIAQAKKEAAEYWVGTDATMLVVKKQKKQKKTTLSASPAEVAAVAGETEEEVEEKEVQQLVINVQFLQKQMSDPQQQRDDPAAKKKSKRQQQQQLNRLRHGYVVLEDVAAIFEQVKKEAAGITNQEFQKPIVVTEWLHPPTFGIPYPYPLAWGHDNVHYFYGFAPQQQLSQEKKILIEQASFQQKEKERKRFLAKIAEAEEKKRQEGAAEGEEEEEEEESEAEEEESNAAAADESADVLRGPLMPFVHTDGRLYAIANLNPFTIVHVVGESGKWQIAYKSEYKFEDKSVEEGHGRDVRFVTSASPILLAQNGVYAAVLMVTVDNKCNHHRFLFFSAETFALLQVSNAWSLTGEPNETVTGFVRFKAEAKEGEDGKKSEEEEKYLFTSSVNEKTTQMTEASIELVTRAMNDTALFFPQKD